MSSPWIFICPSSKGIGYALTRHLLKTTTLPILASTRHDPSSTKSALLDSLHNSSSDSSSSSSESNKSNEDAASRLSLVNIDVTDESTIQAAAQRASELFPSQSHHLRLACAVPGVLYPEKNPKQIDYEKSLETFRVNTMGPLMLIKHFAEFLPKKATELDPSPEEDSVKLPPSMAVWLSMSARVGSISDNKAGGWYSYRASKTAVASLSKSFDNFLYARLGDKGVAVGYHPGTVKTDLSKGFWESVGEDKLFAPEDAAKKMVDVIQGLKVEQRGKCWDWKNEEVPP